MIKLNKKQRAIFTKNIRQAMEKLFPGTGCGRQMALLLGVSPSTISQWANGKKTPSLRHLCAMAKLFNIPLHQLCGLPKPKRIQSKNLAMEIILKLAACTDKKKHPVLLKTTGVDMREAINLIVNELNAMTESLSDGDQCDQKEDL